jgi:sterol desaturase/sphingolipid hydroxylase (fatty acid hydroxylase superfamily)
MVLAGQISPLIAIPLTLAISSLAAEFLGYWLHRLLHGDKLPLLSRSHLIHHFLIYGPGQPMRHDHYQDATDNRFSVGNVGLEWLAPSAVILAVVWVLMVALRIPALYQSIALATLIVWPIFMFSYLHDRMHLSEFWMAQNPLLHSWFRAARRLHDIHHHAVDDNGRMDTNFGIGFFLFDRIFRTMASHHRPFNRAGFETARRRYGLIERNGKLIPSTDLSIYSALPASRLR